jgi:hypothetical protein
MIVKINGMDEGRRPVFHGKAGAIKKSTSPNTKFIIVNLNRPILRRAIRTSRLQTVPELPQEEIAESNTRGRFATLIRADTPTIGVAVQL